MDTTSPDDREPAMGAGHDGVAGFVEELAASLNSIAHRLRTRRFEQLVDDARQLAYARPGLFVAGSVAVGFGLARLLKATSGPAERGAGPMERAPGPMGRAPGPAQRAASGTEPASRDDAGEWSHG